MFNLFPLTFANISHHISFDTPMKTSLLFLPSPMSNYHLSELSNHKGEARLVETCCRKRNVPFDLSLFIAGHSNIKFPLLQGQEPFFVFSISETHPVLMAKEKKSQITSVENGSSEAFCETNEATAFPFLII